MSRLQKIQELDRELKETLKQCSSEGMSKDEIRAIAAPVLTFHENWRRKERLQRFIFLAILVACVAALYQNEATSEFISAVAKIGMVKLVLPYWDWTTLHQRDCIFENPYRATNEITEEDCQPLIALSSIEREAGMSKDDMTEEHLFSAVPVIITDAMSDWKAFKDIDFNHEFITKLYHDDPVLQNTSVCSFSGKESALLDVLDNLATMDNFQMHWGHCKLPAAKVIRTFYKRPYFLPGMVEADTKNYLVIGQKKVDKESPDYTAFATFDVQMVWFSQVKGQFKFKLYPHDLCRQTTSILEDTLTAGETLVYASEMWQLHYSAAGEGEAVAISSGGTWSD